MLAAFGAIAVALATGPIPRPTHAPNPTPMPAPAEAPPAAPPTVAVVPGRAKALVGSTAEILIEVQVTGAEAESYRPVRVLATVGTLETPRPSGGPGRFTARYFLPAERFPQVALLVVELASGTRHVLGTGRIALEAPTIVPFHTNPGAAVTMRVGERPFGPVVADRSGHVDIPIEVPPGIHVGLARAVDHTGAARETEVDLQLPPFPRVALLAPAALEVGGFAEVAVVAVEGNGTAAAVSGLALGASDGLVHPLGAGPAGEARFLFEAPRRVGGGAVALTATAAGTPAGRADVAVPLRPRGPAQLVLAPTTRRLVVGGAESSTIVITSRDAFGNPTSAAGVEARVDGVPGAVTVAADGTVTFTVAAPARFSGRDRIDLEASLGPLRASEQIHLTGGAPARLSIEVGSGRLVADGQQSTEVRVQAVDRNGTPTTVPGLSWDTPEGRVRRVRVPRDGEYVAEYVPERTREPHRHVVAVMASLTLRADASLEVIPPPVRLVAAARAGLYTNFGRTAGAAAFLEALRPLGVRGIRFQAGLTAGYMHGEATAQGLSDQGNAHVQIDQIPVLAMARARAVLPFRFEAAVDVAAGLSWADIRISPDPKSASVAGTALAPALAAGAEVSLPLKPGRLVIGLRYLWVELGTTSEGDRVEGNAAGFVGDIGYKMTF